ncbi:MAG: hypothetical protein AB8B85_04115 [Paracoccaceae bacterium]
MIHDPDQYVSMRRLWHSVMLNVFRDLCITGESAAAHNARSMAARWVGTYPTSDFKLVCELCGVDAETTHMRMREIILMSDFERKEWWHEHGFLIRISGEENND